MRLRHLNASTVVVESDDVSVLCDPWMLDGAFYGSWAHYPPLDYEPEDYADVDFIYVSHIHPDHFHRPTMERLDEDTPVLIHDFATDFLRQNIEALGFEDVRELPHDERTHLAGDLHLNILGADDCDPEACGSYFGCSWWMDSVAGRRTDGSTQIDSMGVFDDGEDVLVNANDCRWPMSDAACRRVVDRYGDVTMLLVQYAAANFYPQCMGDYPEEQLRAEQADVIEEMYQDAEAFVNVLEPDYFMPFAGDYTLAGKYAWRNDYLAVPERHEARDHFETSENVPEDAECVLLDAEEHLDLETGEQSAPFTPVDPKAKEQYIEEELSTHTYPYEDDEMPTLDDLEALLDPAFGHLTEKREAIGYESDTTVLLDLVDGKVAAFAMNDGGSPEILSESEAADVEEYVRMQMDPRLLARILKGPQHAHFNNAEIGSHITVEKQPDVYERPLYYAMSFFHEPTKVPA
ncbi:MBL fold metallo-hydrolase [Halobacterium zhouii]|uniref:MBL fold metallo-hydrolase n=1 Tax=Halobacterium zhouii TaxID=2902624 RepID=UPI001E462CEB|nr:MBL fold metallo-hydrolase [Halobacterium zhouii]